MCLKPVKIKYHDNYHNYRGVLIHPFNEYQYVQCGKCLECRNNKIEEWVIRWTEQLKVTPENTSYFITLTYSDENLNYLEINGIKRSTLYYKDVTDFLKRLRKRQDYLCKKNGIPHKKITYHGCGEYGKKFTKRPHYHILITNLIVNSDEIQYIWGKGNVHVGENVTADSINYILKYSLKQSLLENEKIVKIYNTKEIKIIENPFISVKNIQEFEDLGYKIHTPIPSYYNELKLKYLFSFYENGKNYNRVIEKSFQSKGIGENYLTEKKIKEHIKNPLLGYYLHDIKKNILKQKPLPRYYTDKIFNPPLRDENGKIQRNENGNVIPLFNPKFDEYLETPRFKKQLKGYERQQKLIKIHFDNYIINPEKLHNSIVSDLRTRKDKLQRYISKGEAFREFNLRNTEAEMFI